MGKLRHRQQHQRFVKECGYWIPQPWCGALVAAQAHRSGALGMLHPARAGGNPSSQQRRPGWDAMSMANGSPPERLSGLPLGDHHSESRLDKNPHHPHPSQLSDGNFGAANSPPILKGRASALSAPQHDAHAQTRSERGHVPDWRWLR